MTLTRGRPRSPGVEAGIADAVHQLLAERGYAGTSIEQIAVTAGVAKTTVYRRWASKAELVFEVVVHGRVVEPPSDTGTLDGDLTALTTHVVALLSAASAREAVPGLLADLRADPTLAARFEDIFIEAERQLVSRLLLRAVERGELVKAPDPRDVHAQLLGTVFAWVHLVADPQPDVVRRVSAALSTTVRHGAGGTASAELS